MDETRDRVPVIAGIITNSARAAIERARALQDLGVAALQVTLVHYLFAPDEEASLRHFAVIAAATAVPVIIYNVSALELPASAEAGTNSAGRARGDRREAERERPQDSR